MAAFGSVDGARRWGAFLASVWLVYLAFPIAYLVQAHPGPSELAAGVLGSVAFAAGYVWLWVRRPPGCPAPPRALLALLGLLALALQCGLGPGWLGTGIYVAVASGALLPPRHAAAAVLGLVVLELGVVAGLGVGWAGGAPLLLLYLMMGLGGLGLRRLILVNIELRHAREDLARLAVAEERARFARDLHDLLGHSLSVIALKSELAGRLLAGAPERAEAEIRDIERVSREALREVREAVAGYRQPTLARELAGARTALAAAGIALQLEEPDEPLPPGTEPVLAWTVREGATNVIRHSRARSCRIRVFRESSAAGIEILDDGAGNAPAGAGSGLRGLAERVSARGGSLEAGALPEGGFRLRVTVAGEA